MIFNKNFLSVIISSFILIFISACSSDTVEKEWFIINEDFSHFYMTHTLDEMDIPHLG